MSKEEVSMKMVKGKVGMVKEAEKIVSTPQNPQQDVKPKTATSTEYPESGQTHPPKKAEEISFKPEETSFLGLPLQDKTEDEKRLIRFKEFLNTQWGLPAANIQLRRLFSGGYPPIPLITTWKNPKGIDVTQLTWEQVQTENFIDEIWPSITMMLGDDIDNFEWAARVATVLSFFNIIRVLPIISGDIE